MICPTCDGAKVGQGIACGPAGSRVGMIMCSTCRGMGEISEERAGWIERGTKLRWFRTARGLSLREAAKRFGVYPAVWSDAEHGKIDPTPVLDVVRFAC